MLFEALTTRKTVTVGERLIVPYKLAEVLLVLYLRHLQGWNLGFWKAESFPYCCVMPQFCTTLRHPP